MHAELMKTIKKLKATDAELVKTNKKLRGTENELCDVKTMLCQVASESDGFMQTRNRFFALFRDDHFNTRGFHEDQHIIQSGTKVVYAGNAIMDAVLFDKNLRDDTDTFKLLYGVMPDTVLTILSMLF